MKELTVEFEKIESTSSNDKFLELLKEFSDKNPESELVTDHHGGMEVIVLVIETLPDMITAIAALITAASAAGWLARAKDDKGDAVDPKTLKKQ